MKFNHCVPLIIFSITLLLERMSLYSANKLKSTLPPSGLKLILLDSGWFRSFPYASHNVNALRENQMEFGFNEPFQLFVFCRLILLFCDLSRVICSSTYYIHSEPLNDNEVPTRTNTIFSPSKCYFDKMKGTESWFPVHTQSTYKSNRCISIPWLLLLQWVHFFKRGTLWNYRGIVAFVVRCCSSKKDTHSRGEQRFPRKRAFIGRRALNRIITVQLMPFALIVCLASLSEWVVVSLYGPFS